MLNLVTYHLLVDVFSMLQNYVNLIKKPKKFGLFKN